MSLEAAHLFGDWLASGQAEGMELGHGDVVEQMLDRARFAADSRLLDLGCGTGWTVRRLAARLDAQGSVAGCDLSPAMIASARSRSEDARCSFAVAAADALPYADAEFSGVVSMESLYYWPEPEAGLHEILRVLAPGSAVWIGVDYHADNPASAGWPEELGLALDRRSGAEWAATLRACGFREVGHDLLFDRRPERRVRHPHGTALIYGVR
ncbi:MAG: class I SAM-dependent methyltransferase [Planctomycetota bacterium]|nr:class I SAM-dependent methyltransferase [Planctomycetota bacterium]